MSDLQDYLQTHCLKISLRQYRTQMHIGAYAQERLAPQPVIFDADVWVLKNELISDSLDSVYDYTAIIATIDQVICNGHIDLQETVVQRISNHLLQDQRVRAVRIASSKPDAIPNAQSIGVELFSFSGQP